MPSHREDNTDALRHGRCHFVIDIEGAPVQAPDIRVLKLFDDTLVTLGAARAIRLREAQAEGRRVRRAPTISPCNSLPAIELIDRELARAEARLHRLIARLLGAGGAAARAEQRRAAHASGLARGDSARSNSGSSAFISPFAPIAFPLRLMWHSSYDRDECHEWVRGEFANLAREMESAG